MDLKYNLISVPRHAGAFAERIAILRPVSPKSDLRSDIEVWKAVKFTQQQWRRRLVQLRDAGWGPAQGLRGQYLRNCPPAIVNSRPDTCESSRFCRLGMVCPWCWARRVVKRTWDIVTSVLLRLDSMYQRGRSEYPYKLVYYRGGGVIADDENEPKFRLAYSSNGLDQARRDFRKEGMVALANLAVVQPLKEGRWGFSRRCLAIFPSSAPPMSIKHVTVKPTRRNVARLVGQFARYPAGNLFGDVNQLVRLLSVRSRYRLLRFCGEFSVLKGSSDESESDQEG